jgi:F0F1-type ATP synthase beta subunit
LTLGQAVELLGAGLVSTRRGAITTLVRLALPGSSLEEVAETLSLGEVDAQLMLRSSGRVDASRSRSRSEVSEELMGRRMAAQAALAEADALAERQRIFGSDELTDAERALLEETRRWR